MRSNEFEGNITTKFMVSSVTGSDVSLSCLNDIISRVKGLSCFALPRLAVLLPILTILWMLSERASIRCSFCGWGCCSQS